MKLTTGIVAKLDRMIKIELRPFLLFVLMLKIIWENKSTGVDAQH